MPDQLDHLPPERRRVRPMALRHRGRSLPPQPWGVHETGSTPPDPEEAIRRAQLGPCRGSLVHGELVAQGEVLEGELAVAAAEEGEETKHVEQEGDHGARILSGSEPTDQPLALARKFWRGTGQIGAKGGSNAQHWVALAGLYYNLGGSC